MFRTKSFKLNSFLQCPSDPWWLMLSAREPLLRWNIFIALSSAYIREQEWWNHSQTINLANMLNNGESHGWCSDSSPNETKRWSECSGRLRWKVVGASVETIAIGARIGFAPWHSSAVECASLANHSVHPVPPSAPFQLKREFSLSLSLLFLLWLKYQGLEEWKPFGKYRVSSQRSGMIFKFIIHDCAVLSLRLSFIVLVSSAALRNNDETVLIFRRSNLIKGGSNNQKSY